MNFENILINGASSSYSHANHNIRYNIVKVMFDRNNIYDSTLLSQIYNNGIELAQNVNTHAANNGLHTRSNNILQINAVSGLLAEYAWKEYLNFKAGRKYIDFTDYLDPHDQVDLKIIDNSTRIEVRSSFVRNGLEFALCNKRYIFDVLGPYTNLYKPNETFKDYYVRVLYHMQPSNFWTYFNSTNINVYLTCGATSNMMHDNSIYIYKNLAPAEALINIESQYRCIPFNKSYDTIDISNLIIRNANYISQNISTQ